MNRTKHFFSWCCLTIGGVLLCFFVLDAIVDDGPTPATAYIGASLSGLMAAAGWHNLKKTPSKSE